MNYNQALEHLSRLDGIFDAGIEIRNLGKRSQFIMSIRFENGMMELFIINSGGSTSIVTEDSWNAVLERYFSLEEKSRTRTSSYTDPAWTIGNPSRVFSPYIAAIIDYLENSLQEPLTPYSEDKIGNSTSVMTN